MEKTFVKAGMFRSIFAVITVLSLLAACSGVIPDDEITQAEQAAIRENGAAIKIPLITTAASASRTTISTTTNIGFGLDDTKLIADYYEAYLRGPGTATSVYVGSAQAGVDYLLISVVPGTYSVLVLGGTSASGDSITGEKVLLGSGSGSVTAVQGKVTTAPISMAPLTFFITISGVAKGSPNTLSGANGVPVEYDGPTTLPTGNVTHTAPFYARFENNAAPATGNPPWSTGTTPTLSPLIATVKITGLATIKTWMGTGTTVLSTGTTARIQTLSTVQFAMAPVNLTYPTTNMAATGTTDFAFTLANASIPKQDAAGVFFFNIILPDPRVVAGTTASQWNIRNRLLRNAEGYYGGGIAFLFGNVGTTWVQVIPNF